jgi:hypothetical protein
MSLADWDMYETPALDEIRVESISGEHSFGSEIVAMGLDNSGDTIHFDEPGNYTKEEE